MKADRSFENLPPGEEDACRQDWKHNPETWRGRFFKRNPQLAEEPHARNLTFGARAHEVADGLERYFDTLPNWEHRVHTKGPHKGQRY
jgi:hypothetical protein